jgi:hypothetical protein
MIMEKKERPLDKMTAKELREMAMGLPGIHGVHAMKKAELIAVIRKAKGLPEEEIKKPKAGKKEKKVYSIADLKKKVKELRARKEEALQQQNLKLAEILRKRISRYKKKTRRIAA